MQEITDASSSFSVSAEVTASFGSVGGGVSSGYSQQSSNSDAQSLFHQDSRVYRTVTGDDPDFETYTIPRSDHPGITKTKRTWNKRVRASSFAGMLLYVGVVCSLSLCRYN